MFNFAAIRSITSPSAKHRITARSLVVAAIPGRGLDLPSCAIGCLGDPVRDVIDRIEPGHVLLLQEIDSAAIALGEHGDHHVRAGDLPMARGLDMDSARCNTR
jgi:hypothetical protein